MMYIKVAFISSLFTASPFIFHQLWLFISPPCSRRKEMGHPFVFATTSSSSWAAPSATSSSSRWPASFSSTWARTSRPSSHQRLFLLAFRVLFGIAAIFELPVLVFLLARLRIVSARFLLRYFKHAIVVIFVLAAVITPTPDMVTQTLFAAPMILLYLLSILIARLVNPDSKEEKE